LSPLYDMYAIFHHFNRKIITQQQSLRFGWVEMVMNEFVNSVFSKILKQTSDSSSNFLYMGRYTDKYKQFSKILNVSIFWHKYVPLLLRINWCCLYYELNLFFNSKLWDCRLVIIFLVNFSPKFLLTSFCISCSDI